MICIILGILLIINIYGVARKENNKPIILSSLIMLYLIMALNTFTTDYPHYENYYNTQKFPGDFEFGFVALSQLIYLTGLDYRGFLMLFFFSGFVCNFFAVKNLDINIHCAILLYALTQIFMDTNEIRQFMAYCIIAVALTYYAKTQSMLKYLAFTILAGLFHRSAMLLLIFPFMFYRIKNRETWFRFLFFLICIFCIVIFVNHNKIPGLSQIITAMGLAAKAVYFESSTHWGFILFWMAYFSNMLIVWTAKKIITRDENNYTEIQKKYICNLWEFLLYTAFAMPLCMLNSEFLRYYKFSVIPVIMTISIIVNRDNTFARWKYRLSFRSFELWILFYLVAYSLTFQHWGVVEQVVTNNILNNL